MNNQNIVPMGKRSVMCPRCGKLLTWVIDIFEPFEVGNSLMMFPKDHSLGAQVKEIAGCRCSLKY